MKWNLKVTLSLILVLSIILLAGCDQIHNRNILTGVFISDESFSCENNYYSAIRLEVNEITEVTFDEANFVDVIEDFSTPIANRKYYSFVFSLKFSGGDYEYKQMRFIQKGNQGTGPDSYIISLMLFDGSSDSEYNCLLHFTTYYEINVKHQTSEPNGEYYRLYSRLMPA